jgi:hypothetical protein
MSCASFSSARPAMRRAWSSGLRAGWFLSLGSSLARAGVVKSRPGPADAPGTLPRVTTNQKGAIAEACIAAAVLKLGIDVYRPVAEGGRYDLIFDLGSDLLRVQCKWASRRRDVIVINCESSRRCADGFLRQRYSAAEIDAIAAYDAKLDSCFLVPVAIIDGRPSITLRLDPCRNNQRRGVNWADDFDFAATLRGHQGAVAQLGERERGTLEVTGSSPVGSIQNLPR